ncbi:O-methyltransferase [Fervidibacillus halotolerans]|uniref:tRNA 5-hydroxyuridine methyltransferase n=1 Tax=Fervidibacillus halotolerans TaxID=2980027 RepID=A0A9E8LXI6_9BACI|nr:O-methyltransferase [Fervidibacillus halotolerans]WAA11543.1 O-methyltransferase [Fervidibacillus halotolerans]
MLDGKLKEYLNEKIPEKSPLLKEIENYAKKEYIPIMEPYSMEVLLQLLKLYKPKTILEIGTAIGYSAIRMAMATDATIVTVEKDPQRIQMARKFILQSELSNRIVLLEGDALNIVEKVELYAPYDCLFIDAAKVQYKTFFTNYEKYLTERAVIITDNVLFKGYVYDSGPPNKKLQRIGKKIDEYNQWLLTHPAYDTVILPVGDGMSVSIGKCKSNGVKK